MKGNGNGIDECLRVELAIFGHIYYKILPHFAHLG
jgi:hypothetical protein